MSRHHDKIIRLMSRKRGAMNHELNAVCFRYGARIKELRDAGYRILTEAVDRKHGLYRYIIKYVPKKFNKQLTDW